MREADNLLLIKGAIPGAKGDYVVIRESKKHPKGWKAPVATVGKKKGRCQGRTLSRQEIITSHENFH